MRNLSIEQNLTRIFKTKKLSLPLNPDYGLSYEWIDKPLTQELQLKITSEIKEQIQKYEPRIIIESIKVLKEDSSLLIFINGEFKINL